ncbi:hypothetical protein G7K_0233-t1 [Saitoella complicata NRRL Y-17804]|uniref:Uncharacterized protein n=1 Tax=Saitoella complicata (strain BCRC 22490 / CBS 7301 / JCM 7358 / NBRC 10748 / NRRL Y-17804) TaxID=698492 RepID=A0A0E9N862_SAICN|nr:hypothetical protein G7K_0233-t1 [Saitoella complicata NRRL Y-17804]
MQPDIKRLILATFPICRRNHPVHNSNIEAVGAVQLLSSSSPLDDPRINMLLLFLPNFLCQFNSHSHSRISFHSCL